jgi:outer membrane protein OmpA-like peptidoglycan-associated protein
MLLSVFLMHRRIFLLFLFFNISLKLFSQEILWATKVLEKSSEAADALYSPKKRAIQILGAPNVLPRTGSSPCSWQPAGSAFGEDYIKVGFSKAIKVKQIYIGESLRPGAIARIFGYSKTGQEILIYENREASPRLAGRMWVISLKETTEEINALKILVVHSLNKGQKEYDAIGISEIETSYIPKINVASNLPKDLIRENLGDKVNSKYGEVSPQVSPDGKTIFFTRLNHPENVKEKGKKSQPFDLAQDIWFSSLESENVFSQAKNIGEPLNNTFNNAAATVSGDGRSLYVLNVYKPNGGSETGLSKATKKNNKWEFPVQVKIEDFQAMEIHNDKLGIDQIVTEYSISTDEKYLVMGLKRLDTFGDKDLYVSVRKGKDLYAKPINLGKIINSAGNEGSPFLAADNKTLYFNSDGFPSYGDADIYVSTRLDDTWTNWSEPINLGPVINSPEWDGYITIPASGEYAYFSSTKNSMGSEDIFKVKLFPAIKPNPVALYEISFKDKKTKNSLQPQVNINHIKVKVDSIKPFEVNLLADEEKSKVSTFLNVGELYELKAELAGYEPFEIKIDLQKVNKYKEVKVSFDLVPLSNQEKTLENLVKGEKLILKNLLFEQGKSELREQSFLELDKIIKLMQEKPKLEILLEGHTDNQGDMIKNLKLAEDRVKAVKDYLVSKGQIEATRISLKSWGPYKPLVTNSSEEARQQNRRVEFTITKD